MEPRSIRLNYTNRQLFVDTVMKKLMPISERPDIKIFYEDNKKTIYKYIYGPFKDLIAQLPSWATVKTSKITVCLGTEQLIFPLDKEELAFDNGENFMPAKMFVGVCKLSEHDPLTLAFKASQQQTLDWNTKHRALKKELQKVTLACNTSAQLYQAWPQSLDYAFCFPYKGSKTMPKVKVDSAVLDMTLQITKSIVGSPNEN